MNDHEKKVFDYLRECNRTEAHYNRIVSGVKKIDRTDAKNALESLTKRRILLKRKQGKFVIYGINRDYQDVTLQYIEHYESQIKGYEDEINKSINYLTNKKLFSRDLKFVNKTIKNNTEAFVRFTKAIIDIASTVGYIEVSLNLDDEHSKRVREIQKTAFQTARKITDRFFYEHMDDQPNLSTYLAIEMPVMFTIA